jgi:hypothetical protein
LQRYQPHNYLKAQSYDVEFIEKGEECFFHGVSHDTCRIRNPFIVGFDFRQANRLG